MTLAKSAKRKKILFVFICEKLESKLRPLPPSPSDPGMASAFELASILLDQPWHAACLLYQSSIISTTYNTTLPCYTREHVRHRSIPNVFKALMPESLQRNALRCGARCSFSDAIGLVMPVLTLPTIATEAYHSAR